jgi:hypothetical protein
LLKKVPSVPPASSRHHVRQGKMVGRLEAGGTEIEGSGPLESPQLSIMFARAAKTPGAATPPSP